MCNMHVTRVPHMLHVIFTRLTCTPSQVSYLKPIFRVHAWVHKTQFISYSMQQANRDKHMYM